MTSPQVELPNPGPPGGPFGPTGGPAGGRRFPEGVALALAAVFGAVILLAGFLAVRSIMSSDSTEVDADALPTPAAPDRAGEEGDDTAGAGGDAPGSDDDPAAGAGEEAADDPAETSPAVPDEPVEGATCPTGVEVAICDAAAFVEQTRGRPFKEFPTVEILENEAFDQALLSEFEEYEDEIDLDGEVLTALGLLSPEVSLTESFREALELGVVGFYDPETGRLVVRGVELNLYAQLVLVHELVHAFDDQWFDLNRDDFIDDDADYGFTAVVEGNASRIDEAWRATLSPADQVLLSEQELGALSVEDIRRYLALPAVLRDLQLSPYVDGAAYVRWLVANGGEAAVDEALATPPLSSEEVLHPGRTRDRDPEIEVAAPPAGGTVIDEGRLGEFILRLWLGQPAATGWGGDRYVAWSEGSDTCLTVDVAADTAGDLNELESAGQLWVRQLPDRRSMEQVTAGSSDLIRLTGCA